MEDIKIFLKSFYKEKNFWVILSVLMVGLFVVSNWAFAYSWSQIVNTADSGDASGGSIEVVIPAVTYVKDVTVWASVPDVSLATSTFGFLDCNAYVGGSFVSGHLANSNGRCGGATASYTFDSFTVLATSTVGSNVYNEIRFEMNSTTTISGFMTLRWDTGSGSFYVLGNSSDDGNSNVWCGPTTACNQGSTGNVQNIFYGINSSVIPPGPAPVATFVYPTNGLTTAPFKVFAVRFDNLIATHTYQVFASSSYLDALSFSNRKVVNSPSIIREGDVLMSYGYTVPFPLIQDYTPFNGWDVSSTVQLYDITDFQVPMNFDNFLVASSSISWHLMSYKNNGLNVFFGTTTIMDDIPFFGSSTTTWNGTVATSTSDLLNNPSSTAYCAPASSITDIGGGVAYAFCNIFTKLLFPSPTLSQSIANEVQSFQNVFPFSLFYNVVGGAQTAIRNADVSTSTVLSLNVMGYSGNTVPLVTINSSTLVTAFTTSHCTGSCPVDTRDRIFFPIKMGIWIIAGIKIVAMITSAI